MTYTLEQKLNGEDLYGLPCRIPKPTSEQAKCSHREFEKIDDGYEDWDGEWRSDFKQIEASLMEDIEGTNNIRCSRCGYTRRY